MRFFYRQIQADFSGGKITLRTFVKVTKAQGEKITTAHLLIPSLITLGGITCPRAELIRTNLEDPAKGEYFGKIVWEIRRVHTDDVSSLALQLLKLRKRTQYEVVLKSGVKFSRKDYPVWK